MKLKNLFKAGLDTSVDTVKGMFWAACIKVGVWLVAIALLVLVLVKLVDYASDRYACHAAWVDSDIESKFTYRGGCLVNIKGTWIPAANYRVD